MKKLLKVLVASGLVISLLAACKNQYLENIKTNQNYDFPKGFLWGTATAAYQTEGNIINDWSTNGLDAGIASDGFKQYKKDIERIKYLGNNSYRFSVEWASIEPQKGKFNLEVINYYKDLLKELRKNNIKPMVTLHHFTNPVWVAQNGGWENPQTINDFLEFVKFTVNQLKDDADLWITINEPNVYAFKAYDSGEFPPYKKNREAAIKVMGHLLKAHGQSYRLIHQIDKNAKVSFAQHIALLEPLNKFNPVDGLMTYFQNKVFNLSYWDSIVSGQINIDIPGMQGFKEPFNQDLQNSVDFIGVNYYTRWKVNSSGQQITGANSITNDLGWEIYPEGLLQTLRMANKYAKKLHIPIYITENGIDDTNDSQRSKYIVEHTYSVWKAIKEGIPVKSYMYWSLMDNFEWAEKFKPKFGLYTINRERRKSALTYKSIAEHNSISRDLIKSNQ